MSDATSVTIERFLRKADAGEPFLLLDVRNDEEYRRWRVEAVQPIETLHIPYFDFVEEPEQNVARVPGHRPVFAICAKGDSSDFVAELLREAGVTARNIEGGMVAYGEFLLPVRVPLAPDEEHRFEIWQLNRRGKGCLSYVIRSGDEAVVVDPSRQIEAYESFAAGLGARIVHVFDTHVHADHLSGGPSLAPRAGADYFVMSGEGFELRHPVRSFGDGEEIRLGGEGGVTLTVRLLRTPGHTPGSTSFLVGRQHLITGDTIFVSSIGRPDLGGHAVEWGRMLYRTLHETIASLGDDTVVLPAHHASTSEISVDGIVSAYLGELRRTVPEMRIATEEEFVEAMQSGVQPPPAVYEQIMRANLGLLDVSAEDATEWDLGKNQCAASQMKAAERGRD